MSRTRRITAIALAIFAFFIFVGSPFEQSANAVALTGGALIAIIILGLAAMGITFAVTNGYQNAETWVSDMINLSGANFGSASVAISSSSKVLVNNRFIVELKILADYIRLKYNLVDGQNHVVAETYALEMQDGQKLAITAGDWANNTAWPPEGTVYTGTLFDITETYYFNNGSYMYCTVIGGSFTIVEVDKDGRGRAATIPIISGYYGLVMNYNGADSMRPVAVQNGLTLSTEGMSYNNFLDFIPVGSTVDLSLRVGTLDIPTDQEIGDNSGVIVGPFPWSETLPGLINDVPDMVTDGVLDDSVTLTLESTQSVEDQIDSEASNVEVVSQTASSYQSPGLQDVFPFCIPFDIYAFFECLAADPVAPSFTWRFYVPGICDEEIELDLSEFDTVAQIVRTMELLAFIVGLALVTRDKFLRG